MAGKAPSAHAPPAQQGSSRDMEESPTETRPTSSHSTASAGRPKLKRKRITPEQSEVLNKVFETNDTPNLETREQLSKQIGMTPREIQVYYQNQRAKRRRLARNEAAQNPEPPSTTTTPSPLPAQVYLQAAGHLPMAMPGVAAYPAGPSVLPMPAPVLPVPVWSPRRQSADEPVVVTRPPAPPAGEAGVRLPPLREIFADLMPPLPAAAHQYPFAVPMPPGFVPAPMAMMAGPSFPHHHPPPPPRPPAAYATTRTAASSATVSPEPSPDEVVKKLEASVESPPR